MTFMLVSEETSMAFCGVVCSCGFLNEMLKVLFLLFHFIITLDFEVLNFSLYTGAKMFYNAPEMMFRRELEGQADLQQAIELQRRRFMNLQLPDFKNDGIHHHQRSLSVGASVSLPAYSHTSQDVHPSDSIKQEVSEGLLISLISISYDYLFVGYVNLTLVVVCV